MMCVTLRGDGTSLCLPAGDASDSLVVLQQVRLLFPCFFRHVRLLFPFVVWLVRRVSLVIGLERLWLAKLSSTLYCRVRGYQAAYDAVVSLVGQHMKLLFPRPNKLIPIYPIIFMPL